MQTFLFILHISCIQLAKRIEACIHAQTRHMSYSSSRMKCLLQRSKYKTTLWIVIEQILYVMIFPLVAVERGLVELKKLGIEGQLWQASRKLVDPDSEHKWQMHINF